MYVKSLQECKNLVDLAKSLVLHGATYPDQVFRREYRFYFFCEYQVAMSYKTAQALACRSDDSVCFYVHLAPEMEYWTKVAGHGGVVACNVDQLEHDWDRDFFSLQGPQKVSLAHTDGPAVTFGNRLQWTAFHNYSQELSVIGSDTDILSGERNHYIASYVHRVDWAVLYFNSQPVHLSHNFLRTLRVNYKGTG